jgi:hypothetical protein
LHHKCLGTDGELIALARAGDPLARTSNVAVSAWTRVSPKPTIVSGRRAITRTDTDSPPAGVYVRTWLRTRRRRRTQVRTSRHNPGGVTP